MSTDSPTPSVAHPSPADQWQLPADPVKPRPAEPTSRFEQQAQRPYGNVRRVSYGLLWLGCSVLLLVGGAALLFGAGNGAGAGGAVGGLIAIGLGLLAARYDYRIWTYQAKRLLLFIIF